MIGTLKERKLALLEEKKILRGKSVEVQGKLGVRRDIVFNWYHISDKELSFKGNVA